MLGENEQTAQQSRFCHFRQIRKCVKAAYLAKRPPQTRIKPPAGAEPPPYSPPKGVLIPRRVFFLRKKVNAVALEPVNKSLTSGLFWYILIFGQDMPRLPRHFC
jgi:hypothetical protein